ncbi:hypothetical protein [Agrobacterium tumefaciens]|uniref:Tail fiber protein n=1 Tax=Agrobacterium tumefaciens TaxID=358 RepID=A0AAW8LV26_AGRTU|nr:hypothetical protein [Agrobacterium tumefaciens]MDR6702994.1 hypothetical protein [Agrobacterium tumefaciens]
MKYHPPFGSTDPNASYVDKSVPGAVRGSAVPGDAVEDPQREIVNVITKSGIIADDVLQLAKAIQSGRLSYAVAGGTANALTAILPEVPAEIADGMTINIKIGTTNSGAATLNVNGLGARPIVSRRGNPLVQGDLPSGTMATFVALGGSWIYAPLEASSFRRRLSADTNFYVATTGNDNNDGSVGSPWKTLTKASNYLQTQIDLNGFTVTINVANGTYTDPFQLAGYVPGQTGPTKVQVVGNVANPTLCFVNCATVSPFGASYGAAFQVKGFQVAASSIVAQNGSGLYASNGGTLSYESMAFNACVYAQVLAELGGYCVSSGSNTINGNCSTHLFAKDSGTISIANRATTISGGPTFNGAFASAESGTIEAAGATFIGVSNGPRYYANANGVIKTNGGGGNFFPGTAAGSTNAGGQYL